MADNEHEVDLVKVIKENFSAIQDGSYDWNQEEVDSLYKIIRKVIMDTRINFGGDKDDVIAEMAFAFFADIVKNIDIKREEGISSYIYLSLKGKVLTYYNRHYKKHKDVVELDSPIDNGKNDSQEKVKLELIKSLDKSYYERQEDELYEEYKAEILELIKKVPILNDIYIENKPQREICEKYNLSRNAISYRKKWETEAIKIMLIQKGYTIDLVNPRNTASDIYKYTEKQIMEKGLLNVIYYQGNDVKDVAETLEIDHLSVNFAIRNLLKEKEELLLNRGIKQGECYIEFTKYYFPKKVYNIEKQKEEYFKFIDKILDSIEICSMYFRDRLTQQEIANKFNTYPSIISRDLLSLNKGIKKVYKEYVENDYDLNIVNLSKINEYSVEKKKSPYAKFTKCYFPELLKSDEVKGINYKRFVDKILDDSEIHSMYFRDGLKLREIAEKLNTKLANINSNIFYKTRVRELYSCYIENNYDLNVININSRKQNESKKEHDPYKKFTKYYFPELVDKEESETEVYHKFVDKVLDENEIYSMYFRNNLTFKQVAERLGVTTTNIYSKFYKGKSVVKKMYQEYLNPSEENNIGKIEVISVTKDKKRKVNIVEIIKNNFTEIKNDTYEWSKEEIEAVYKLTYSILNMLGIKFGSYKQDVCQETVANFFSNIVKKIDVERESGISSYINQSLKNSILMYYRKHKKYVDKISLELDQEVDGKDGSSISKKLLIKSDEKSSEEKIDDDYKREYQETLLDIAKDFELLKLYYIDEISQYNISINLNISQSYVSRKIKMEEDALKILLMERGYTADLINNKIKVSDSYKYVEKMILENGLLALIYNKNNEVIDIAESLNMDVRSVQEAIEYLINKKSNLLANRGIDDPSSYLRFTQYYFPKFLHKIESMNDKYFQFIDLIMDSNPIYSMKFRDDLKALDIADKLNMSPGAVSNKLKNSKKEIKKLYSSYIENNCDLNLININSKKQHKLKNKQDSYVKFTKYYFPELVNTKEIETEKYHKFVDKILDSSEIYSMYFRNNLMLKEIAEKLDVTVNSISRTFYRNKAKIRKLYKDYIETKDDLNRFDESKAYDPYKKFTKYHFPKLLNTQESKEEKYHKFVDKILDSDEMYSMYFRDNLSQKEIGSKFNVTDNTIRLKFYNNKKSIINLYENYKKNGYDLNSISFNNPYVKFTKYYFPELLNTPKIDEESYKKFVDKILNDNDVLAMYFREDLTLSEIANRTSKKALTTVSSVLQSNKNKIIQLYDNYVGSNYDLSVVDINKKFVAKHNPYTKFTKYYLPELVGKEESETEVYRKFADKIINGNQIYSMYFIDNLSQKEIADKLNATEGNINEYLYRKKDKILQMYNSYKESNYDLNQIDIRLIKQYTFKNVKDDYYTKFTKYYLPELLDTEEFKEDRYHEFIDKVLEENEILAMYFRDNLLLKEIAEKFNTSTQNINNKFQRCKEKIKGLYVSYMSTKYNINVIDSNLIKQYESKEKHDTYVKFTKYYFPELVNKDESKTEKYRTFVDKILDSDLVYSLCFKDNLSLKEIEEKLNISSQNISARLQRNKIKIRQLYNDYVANEIHADEVDINKRQKRKYDFYERFTKYNLPDLVGKEESKNDRYYEFVNKIVDSDPVLAKWYKENKTAIEIARELNVSRAVIEHKIQRSKKKIIYLYSQFLESDYDVNNLIINYDKYIDELLKRGIENPKAYIKFISYYLPELIDTLDTQDDKFFKMIDWIISKDYIMEKYFKDDKMQTEIANELNTGRDNINKKLKYNTDKIKKIYNDYLICIKIGKEDAHCYLQFTKYYFPEILNDIEKQDETYFDFIDYVVHKNKMLYKFFFEHKSLKELSDELDLKYQVVVDRTNRSKPKIRKLYQDYLEQIKNIKKI